MKRFDVWMLFLVLASLVIAAGTTEPDAPAWRTGPVSFEEATRVPAFYCEKRGTTGSPGTPAPYAPRSDVARTISNELQECARRAVIAFWYPPMHPKLCLPRIRSFYAVPLCAHLRSYLNLV